MSTNTFSDCVVQKKGFFTPMIHRSQLSTETVSLVQGNIFTTMKTPRNCQQLEFSFHCSFTLHDLIYSLTPCPERFRIRVSLEICFSHLSIGHEYLRWGKLHVHCWHSSCRLLVCALSFCSYRSSSMAVNIAWTFSVAFWSSS